MQANPARCTVDWTTDRVTAFGLTRGENYAPCSLDRFRFPGSIIRSCADSDAEPRTCRSGTERNGRWRCELVVDYSDRHHRGRSDLVFHALQKPDLNRPVTRTARERSSAL